MGICFSCFNISGTKRVFEKVDYAIGLFSVNMLLKGVADDFVWACLGVYGPNEDS